MMSSRVYLFFPPRGYKPTPTLRDSLSPHRSLQRCRFSIPLWAIRPDIALYAIGPLFFLPTPSSPHCTLKVSEHDSLWQPPAAYYLDERPRPQKSSPAQRCLNAVSHRVISRARLYEVIRCFGLLCCAPTMRSKTRWCTVRSLA